MAAWLQDSHVDDIQDCLGKGMLAWVSYPNNGTRCFTYPQYLLEGGAIGPVGKQAFPDEGCLPVTIASDETPGELLDKFGHIVAMTVNAVPNDNYNYGGRECHRYNAAINTRIQRTQPGMSVVEIVPLSRHALSGVLMQVIELQETVSLEKPPSAPVHRYPDQPAPLTKYVVIEQVVGGTRKLIGPLEAKVGAADEVSLAAAGAFDFGVAALAKDGFHSLVELKNERGDTAACFVAADELRERFDACATTFDWMGDATLIEALGRIARMGEEPFSKAQVNALRSRIETCAETEAKVSLTSARRARMLALLGTQESWASMSDEVKAGAVEKITPAQLAEYVLSDEHFHAFYDRAIEDSRIRERVDREKARIEDESRRARKDADEAKARLAEVRSELQSFEENLDEKKRQIEADMQHDIAGLGAQRDALAAQVGELDGQKAALEEGCDAVRRQIREMVGGMSDELGVSGKLLESEMLRQVVAALGEGAGGSVRTAPDSGQGEPAERPQPPAPLLRTDEPDARRLVQEVQAYVNGVGERDMDANDVANLLICLAQGYIVTLAGLPGTGKTSLANLLAGALGLKGGEARRFVEVPVERGWTSYKDFIGYYSPFTQAVEKANAAAFDAFERLDAEVEAGLAADEVPPFLFLLDEANLSSIEHYWSPFLRACDSFRAGPSELALGGERLLRVPGYARFIATVNFDHTTEELSPRFLDRSWVITLDPEESDIEDLDAPSAADAPGEAAPLSYAGLQRAFGPAADALLDADLKSKLKEVLDVCARHGQPVSPRSRRMMVSYACTAAQVMDRSSASSSWAPVDYAVCQKVLPRLCGTEERLAGLLGDLKGIGGLTRTRRRVEHMLEVGGDSGYFQYFA